MNNFDLRKFLIENRKPVNEIDADLLKKAQAPAPSDAAEKLAQRKKEQAGALRVSQGENAEEEQKVIDIAREAIALMDEQPGTSAVDALQAILEDM